MQEATHTLHTLHTLKSCTQLGLLEISVLLIIICIQTAITQYCTYNALHCKSCNFQMESCLKYSERNFHLFIQTERHFKLSGEYQKFCNKKELQLLCLWVQVQVSTYNAEIIYLGNNYVKVRSDFIL